MGTISIKHRGGSEWRSVSLTDIWVHLLHVRDGVDALSVFPFSFQSYFSFVSWVNIEVGGRVIDSRGNSRIVCCSNPTHKLVIGAGWSEISEVNFCAIG